MRREEDGPSSTGAVRCALREVGFGRPEGLRSVRACTSGEALASYWDDSKETIRVAAEID